MTRPPAPPIGLKVEEAMTSAEINAELVCPLRTPNFPPGTHDYDPKRHDLIEGVSKCMISGQEAQAKFNEFREAQGSHDEVYTDGSKMNERVGAAAVINRHFQNDETTCRQLSKRLPDNSTICAAEATAISLTLNYYQHMGPVHDDVVVYSDSMSCLQAIEGEDTENPFITPQPSGLEGFYRHGPGGRAGGRADWRAGGRLPDLRNPYLCNRLMDFLHSKFYGIF